MPQQKLLFNNTYESGSYRIFIYKKKSDKEFTAVCLEFDLIIKGKTLKAAKECIMDVTTAWIRNVQENKLSETLLNRPADKKYWELYKGVLVSEQRAIEEEQHKIAAPSILEVSKLLLPSFNLFADQYKGGNFNFA